MLKDLVDLFIAIASQKSPVKVEVNYDGKRFHWIVKVSNVTAVDFARFVNVGEQRRDRNTG